jgi:hypothetical protein
VIEEMAIMAGNTSHVIAMIDLEVLNGKSNADVCDGAELVVYDNSKTIGQLEKRATEFLAPAIIALFSGNNKEDDESKKKASTKGQVTTITLKYSDREVNCLDFGTGSSAVELFVTVELFSFRNEKHHQLRYLDNTYFIGCS